MKKREQGVVSVEASIVLTLMLFCVLFLFSFARVYRAQNLVSHAALQTADAVALESYLRETGLQNDASDIAYLANLITESSAVSADSLESLRSANLSKIAKQKFITAIATTEAKANEKLKLMGVKDGLDGIDFSQCKMDLGNDDVVIAVTYTIKMQFPVFGLEEISITKTAKAKTFGEILFEITTGTNNPGWGSTSGDNRVVHGTEVQIKATPNYGYKFVKWDDGNTDNPRLVKVTEAKTYTAIFERDSFGVNINTKIVYDRAHVNIAHTAYGSVSGAGNYLYLDTVTIKATPAANYVFAGWDLDGDGNVDDTNATRSITVDKTYAFTAIFKPEMKTIKVKASNIDYGTVQVIQGDKKGTSIQVEYGSRVQLIATTKDPVKHLFTKWSNNSTQANITITAQSSTTYEATFISNTYTVTFYNGSTKVHTAKVIRGSSIDASKAYISTSMASNPSKSGATFDKWKCNGSAFTSTTRVNSDIRVDASWKFTVTLKANGGSIDGASSKSYTVYEGGTFAFGNFTPTRNGYNFTGWSGGYSGTRQITSHVTVTANWQCRHYYDNGSTMYYPTYSNGSGCSNTRTDYRCGGCGHTYSQYGYGSCYFQGYCGTFHTAGFNAICSATNYEKHYWNKFSCITCVYCGALRGARVWRNMYVSDAWWCYKHNGHSGRTAKCSAH